MGLDRVEIRRRNFLSPDAFPHDHEILYQDFAPLVYDSGDYEPALDKAIELIGYEPGGAVPREPDGGGPASGGDGSAHRERLQGIGIVSYIEGTGIGPYEGARVRVEASGKVCLVTGVGTQGQGHFTSFAQIVADQLGVGVTDVRVVTGDTREFHWGTGTFASRGAVVAGNACHAAAVAVREKILRKASEILEVAEEDLKLSEGVVRVQGAPDLSIGLGELALRSNPLRGAVEPGTEPGLESTAYFGPRRGATASGVHAMVVSVDPETAMVEVERYVVVHDCGRVINPLIVEGQIHGGVAHGLGNAFYEELDCDSEGQLHNASFMDYLLPTATDVPPIRTAHIETPSPLNPLGIKGVGEAGAIPVAALFAQAVEDALKEWAPGLEVRDIPLSPNRLFALIEPCSRFCRGGARPANGARLGCEGSGRRSEPHPGHELPACTARRSRRPEPDRRAGVHRPQRGWRRGRWARPGRRADRSHDSAKGGGEERAGGRAGTATHRDDASHRSPPDQEPGDVRRKRRARRSGL
jgi:CO/xanthine dehydrogenase Mo-binding subunit